MGHMLVPHSTSCAKRRVQGGAHGLGYFNKADIVIIFECHPFLLSFAHVSEPVKSFRLHLCAEFC